MRLFRLCGLIAIFLSIAILAPAITFAQNADATVAATPFDWQQVLALFINSILVACAVQLVAWKWPEVPGGIKQILALVAGPLLMYAQNAISAAIGYPIDFGPLIAVFTGASTGLAAMGLYDVTKKVARKT